MCGFKLNCLTLLISTIKCPSTDIAASEGQVPPGGTDMDIDLEDNSGGTFSDIAQAGSVSTFSFGTYPTPNPSGNGTNMFGMRPSPAAKRAYMFDAQPNPPVNGANTFVAQPNPLGNGANTFVAQPNPLGTGADMFSAQPNQFNPFSGQTPSGLPQFGAQANSGFQDGFKFGNNVSPAPRAGDHLGNQAMVFSIPGMLTFVG